MKVPETTPVALNDELPDDSVALTRRVLPTGTWVDEFEVEAIIGEGSVAIVYAATDRHSRSRGDRGVHAGAAFAAQG